MTVEGHTDARTSALFTRHFRCIAKNGFGDGMNAYMHAMAWFREHLYVSTTRTGMYAPRPFDQAHLFQIFPVRVPDNPWANDIAAEIWRYAPSADRWDRVHRSGTCIGNKGFEVPRQIGFRCMTTFRGPSDAADALYTVSWSTRGGPGPVIMRCEDGRRFEEISEPGICGFGSESTACRSIVPFRGRLFLSTTGKHGSRDPLLEGPEILQSADPRHGIWTRAAEPRFGNHRNVSVFEVKTFNGFLYAGTMNPYEGFELWKTDAQGEPPFRWRRVLTRGAYRGPLNEMVMSLCEFRGCLYVGTAINNGGHDRTYGVGPGAPEILRVYPDDSWELLVGSPRLTPDGLKVPLSGMGPGFDYGLAGYLWQFCAHDGWLYASTADKTVLLQFAKNDTWPVFMQMAITPPVIRELIRQRGGFDLWRTRDGVHWAPVTRNGFGNPFNIGARTLLSTPVGMFVGTANLFGPDVAVKRTAGWFYVPNEAGGGEVWLGAAAPARAEDARSSPPRPTDESRDGVATYYGGSDFRHLGLWRPGIRTPQAACENLVEELLAFTRPATKWRVPLPTSDAEDIEFFRRRAEHREQDAPERPGAAQSILDLGCGLGATTRHLLKYYPAAQITAVASDSRELAACARNAPGVRVLAMPLPRLLLGEQRFDHVMCVEGPSRLGSPATLLRQVFRVLKPGGWLVCSDLLVKREPKRRWRWKHETALSDPETYRALLRKIGFSDVQVADVTDETWGCSYRHALKFGLEHIASHGVDEEFMREFREELLRSGGADYYVIACARRPREHVAETEGDVSPAA